MCATGGGVVAAITGVVPGLVPDVDLFDECAASVDALEALVADENVRVDVEDVPAMDEDVVVVVVVVVEVVAVDEDLVIVDNITGVEVSAVVASIGSRQV